jgi:hypothetical protein
VAELVDARDLKSLGGPPPCRFNSGPRHQEKQGVNQFQVNPFFIEISLIVPKLCPWGFHLN